jgi:hypothetical protein
MLNTIGESAVRTTTREDNNLAIENKDVALKKVEKAVEERPIESSQESAKPESEVEKKPAATKRMRRVFSLKNTIKTGTWFLERRRNKSR